MVKKGSITKILMLTMLCTACSKLETPEKELFIRLNPVAAAMTAAATRGTQVMSAPTNYGASCTDYTGQGNHATSPQGSLFFNQQITSSGQTGYYWPAPARLIAVYAYYPYSDANFVLSSTATDTGYPTYTYTVPDNVAQQKDIMTANMTDIRCDGSEVVDIVFEHRLTDFTMQVENYTGNDIRINSITVKNLKYTGTLNGSQWTLGNSRKDFTLSVNATVTPTHTLDATGETNHFLMLPQTISSGSQLIDVNLTAAGNTHHFYYQPKADLITQQGTAYTFLLRIKDGISIGTTIGEWEEVNLGYDM